MIAEIRLIHKRLFSVSLGLSTPAKNTFNKSDNKQNQGRYQKQGTYIESGSAYRLH